MGTTTWQVGWNVNFLVRESSFIQCSWVALTKKHLEFITVGCYVEFNSYESWWDSSHKVSMNYG